MTFIDLSQTFEDGMPGFKMKDETGEMVQYTARIRPFFTHEQSRQSIYDGQSAFEVTEMSFQTSVGTYLDSPFHRYPERRDISELRLDEVILPGVVVDVRGRKPFEAVGPEVLPDVDLKGHAVLFNFGWSQYWGSEQYQAYPFIARETIDYLLAAQVKLVGVDAVNVDDSRDKRRPAHSEFLKHDVLVVENLTNLDLLHGQAFRFFAVPIKGKRVAAMPIRAFAEVLS